MGRLCLVVLLAGSSVPAMAQADMVETLRADLAQARAEIAAQRQQLDRQESRLRALEGRIASAAPPAQVASATVQSVPNGVETVGAAPVDFDRMPQGGRAGRSG